MSELEPLGEKIDRLEKELATLTQWAQCTTRAGAELLKERDQLKKQVECAEIYAASMDAVFKERDDLRAKLHDAYRAACHFIICDKCADSDWCNDGFYHKSKLCDCEPLLGIALNPTAPEESK